MVLRIQRKPENRIFKVYMLAMFALLILRYLMKIHVPQIAFLLVAMIPICFGSTSEQLAFAASCIPFSVAFQYKYAILILTVTILLKNRLRLKRPGGFVLVLVMMAWELGHAFFKWFSYVEYLRGFAELLLLGIITSIDLKNVDHKLVIRSLAVSVVGICVLMLVMQLQLYNYNLLAVFSRSVRSFRFGQNNMQSGWFALNFNANNLGFLCNLSACSCLLMVVRKENHWMDIVLAICAGAFALITVSRAAVVCMILIIGAYFLLTNGTFVRRIWGVVGGLLIIAVSVIILWQFLPSVFDNIITRFKYVDVWSGRGQLFQYYWKFLFSSWNYVLFGVGMQQIPKKVYPYYPVSNVPHNGIQEVWVAWGIVGVVMLLILLWKIVTTSKHHAGGKRQPYQFMPLILTLVFTMSGQLLTSSRALLALSISYLCLCVGKPSTERNSEIGSEYE